MTSPYLLVLVLVSITTASQSTQNSAANLNENPECASQFSNCERELHDLRKQRERAKATAYKLRIQLWRITDYKQYFDNEIKILRHQVEHPDEPVPRVGLKGVGPGMIGYPNVVDIVTTNCTANLVRCENSKNDERNLIQHLEQACEDKRSAIAEQLRIQNDLRETAASLKSQLAARNVTPHPTSQHGDFDFGSSSEFDIDSSEVERRVNATVERINSTSK